MGVSEVFTNREISIGVWLLVAICIAFFTKPFHKFLKSAISILLCKKFVVFYIIFLGYFTAIILFLSWSGFWTFELLKDTIFWVLFVELPLFVNAIQKAKNNHFFVKLLKDNLKLVIVFEFVLNFWTFSLIAEFFIVPIAIFVGLLYALMSKDKKYAKVKKVFDFCSIIFGVIVISNAITNVIYHYNELLTFIALKQLLLPFLLLIFNLPVIYGLALYSVYEEVFIRVKGKGNEKIKMKISIMKFAGFRLNKITSIRNNLSSVTVVSLTYKDLVVNLKKLSGKLSVKVGDNYMKRTHYYIFWAIIGVVISALGIIICNSQVSVKDLLSFNFVFDFIKIKEIATYIFSTALVLSLVFFIYAMGLRKRKHEDISQVKKYALHEITFLIKKQNELLQEFIPIDKPMDLFYQYVINAYDIYKTTQKDIELFENLLKDWEIEEIKALNTSALRVVNSTGIHSNDIHKYTADSFNEYFQKKKTNSPQNEKINVFAYEIESGIKKYSEQIKRCYEDFKVYFT